MDASCRHQFERAGYVGPIPVFTSAECRNLLRAIRRAPPIPPADWFKGTAVSSRLYYEIAAYRPLVDMVSTLVGPDVMLWGASLVRRPPGAVHPWHTDIETSADRAGSLSIWIGLQNTSRRSSLRLVRGSHRFGLTIQQAASRRHTCREDVHDDAVADWAREHDPHSELVSLDMGDGEAVTFDGRLWHSSNNLSRRRTRTAILLQYATPDTPIRIPDLAYLEWPFGFLQSPYPGCIMVRGTDRHRVNRTLPAPPVMGRASQPRLSTCVNAIELPLAGDPARDWKWRDIFRGSTSELAEMACHVSVLAAGKTPHPPHEHAEEELLVMLSGEAELVTRDKSDRETRRRVRPRSFAYYPAGQRHTIHNPTAVDATYLMFKWTGQHGGGSDALGTTAVDFAAHDVESAPAENGFHATPLLNGETRHLVRLHAHVTTLPPGGGYAPHVDAYDVAIVTLEGTVETLGQTVGSNSVIFYAAGQPHGMRNVGKVAARYVVFEFHGSRAGIDSRRRRLPLKRFLRPVRSLVTRIWQMAV